MCDDDDWLAGMSVEDRLKDLYIWGGYEGCIAKIYMGMLVGERSGESVSDLDAAMIAAAGSNVLSRVVRELSGGGFIQLEGDEWRITDLGVTTHHTILT